MGNMRAALTLCVLCLSAPVFAAAGDRPPKSRSVAKKASAALKKKVATVRGSMKLEESQQADARVTSLVEGITKKAVDKINSGLDRAMHKKNAGADTKTTGARRSLLQSDAEFMYATSSQECQNAWYAMGATDIAAQVDGPAELTTSSTYAECEDFAVFAISSIGSTVTVSTIPDICDKGCKDDIVHWVGAFQAFCVVDIWNFAIDQVFADPDVQSADQADKAAAAVLLIDAMTPYTFPDKLGISTLLGCDNSDGSGTCESKGWWYEMVIDQVEVDNDRDPVDECDDVGTAGNYIMSCDALGTDYCSGSNWGMSPNPDETSCCFATGLVTGIALEVVAECPFIPTIEKLYNLGNETWKQCWKDEVNFKCTSSTQEKYLNGMELQATGCCAASSPIAAPCDSAGSIASQFKSYDEGRKVVSASNMPMATLFIVVALATLNFVGLA